MSFAGAIFLIVAGAILRYGVNLKIEGVNENVIGLILMIAGAIGLVVAFFLATIWAKRTRPVDRYPDEPRY
ncbi:MAG: DUF6458 family protein [Solirubrobacterales bacterium]